MTKVNEFLDKWRGYNFFFGSSKPYYARIALIFIVNYLNLYLDSWALLVGSQTHSVQLVIAVGYLIYYYGNTGGLHISVLIWMSLFSIMLDFTNITILLVQYFSSYADPKLLTSDGSMTTLAFSLRLVYLVASLGWDIMCMQKSFYASGKMLRETEAMAQTAAASK